MFLYQFTFKDVPPVIIEAENIVKAWEAFFLVFDGFYNEHDVFSVEIVGSIEREWSTD